MSKLIQAYLLGGPGDGQMVAIDHTLEYLIFVPQVRTAATKVTFDKAIRNEIGREDYRRYFDIDEDNAVFLHNMLGEHEAKMLLCRRYFDVPGH